MSITSGVIYSFVIYILLVFYCDAVQLNFTTTQSLPINYSYDDGNNISEITENTSLSSTTETDYDGQTQITTNLISSTSTPTTIETTPNPCSNVKNSQVKNPSSQFMKNTLQMKWNRPPEIPENCNLQYNIFVKNDNQTNRISSTFFNLPALQCKNYSIVITPIVDSIWKGQDVEYIIPINLAPDKSPILNVDQIRKSSITFNYTTITTNLCPINNITVTCQDNLRKKKPHTGTASSGQHQITISKLSKFQDYTCSARTSNDFGDSPSTQDIAVRTLPEVPSPPTNLFIDPLTVSSTQFTLTWEPPDTTNGDITNYNIFVEDLGPQHQIGPNCQYTHNLNLTTTHLEMVVSGLHPHFKYKIEITAVNTVGSSIPAVIEVTTLFGVPSVVTFKITEAELENNSYTLTASWEVSCDPGGKLKGFILEIDGNYFDGTYNNSDKRQFNILGTDVTEKYKKDIMSAHPAYLYDFKIFPYLEDDKPGLEHTERYLTRDGYPLPPIIDEKSIVTTPNSLQIFWTDPDEKFGTVTEYQVIVKSLGAIDEYDDCYYDKTIYYGFAAGSESDFLFVKGTPFYRYEITMTARTSVGVGAQTEPITVFTRTAKPDPPEHMELTFQYNSDSETYLGTVQVDVTPTCILNGKFDHYLIISTASRGPDTIKKETLFYGTTVKLELLPDYDYTLDLFVVTQDFSSDSILQQFHSKSGVPVFNSNNPSVPKANGTGSATFQFSKLLFGEENGIILYYALFIMPQVQTLDVDYGFWINTEETWPSPPTSPDVQSSQITEMFWQPFKDEIVNVQVVLGAEDNCSNEKFCNKYLTENTKYSLIIRALTANAYKDSFPLNFQTDIEATLDLDLILGLGLGIPCTLILIAFIGYLWYRRRRQLKQEKELRTSSDEPSPINIKKFVPYFQLLTENQAITKSQFTTLNNKSKELDLPITYATLPENRRKNRYTNILPFDATRVKLQIDEDDEISSDYINASYIRGYSGKSEYIATQGPLESTCKDFWKMILQENVTVIVMVSQFIEQSKEKCYRYFPNNHETITLSENFEVRCSTELHFGTYCVRTLQVKKDLVQHHVTHMQYLEWPDFGVPTSTDNMLQFCYQVRERIQSEGGIMVVHCSAGVGRTGTLIATDILLQTIEDHRDINIFNTVFELRQQRSNMVQTEKQYLFIYSCIKDALENPVARTVAKDEEPLYENLSVITNKTSLEEVLIPNEVESAL